MSEKPRCRLCYEPTTVVYNIKFKAINICEDCALSIVKQEVSSWKTIRVVRLDQEDKDGRD